MSDVTCPECGLSTVIGLPQDATVETVSLGEETARSTDPAMKTRTVRCPREHAVAVTFSVEIPDHRDNP
jgi:hypothetical protein